MSHVKLRFVSPFPSRSTEITIDTSDKMKKLYEELHEVKLDMDNLKDDYLSKTENLNKSHNEQLMKMKEATQTIASINEKEEAISSIKQLCEEFRCKLQQSESVIEHLTSTNNELRADYHEKFLKWEGENRELVLALDEAKGKSKNQEEKIHSFEEEIESLKRLVSDSQKKCFEAKENASASNELRQRDDFFLKLEEDNRKINEQFKWKREQFNHLKEAHEKLRGQFQASQKEWENEKSSLLDEICKIQTNLDSQKRITEGLEKQSRMREEALRHEENRRKCLEVQISESRSSYEKVFDDYQEAKLKLECYHQRDEEIADLRNLIRKKEMLYKEMEFKVGNLQKENEDLLKSLKEIQESQIQEVGISSSFGKLKNKLKHLEQKHKDCSANLKAKEEEWKLQMEKVRGDLCSKEVIIKELTISLGKKEMLYEETLIRAGKLEEENRKCLESLKELLDMRELGASSSSLEKLQNKLNVLEHTHRDCSANLTAKEAELCNKDAVIEELRAELEDCSSTIMQLKLQNEEISLMMQLNLANEKAEFILQNEEKKENLSSLKQELEMKNMALVESQKEIEKEREKTKLLLRRIESLNYLEKELESHTEMLEELSPSQICSKEQNLEIETELKERLRQFGDALVKANSELDEKFCETSEIEFELQIWKSIAERLNVKLEVNYEMRREVEASLLEQAEVEETLKRERESLVRLIEDKESRIRDLERDCDWMEKEFLRRELESLIFTQIYAEKEVKHLMLLATEDDASEELQKDSIQWRTSAALIKELKAEMVKVAEERWELSSEKENLRGYMVHFCYTLKNISCEDNELMGTLGRMVEKFEGRKLGFDLEGDEELCESAKENVKGSCVSHLEKKLETAFDQRMPFRELNN